ncbi:MAG: hypothetical protein K0U72_03060 [Gammaproteobacteria bacterium]|nr:hypothetical protein [Gammaproteobacteria bacterium]
MEDDAVEKARKNLWYKNQFRLGDEVLTVLCLLPSSERRVIKADWWHGKGKQVSILAIEENGNFFLRHPSGEVLYWNHSEQKDIAVAKSVVEFVRSFEEGDLGY